MASTTYLLRISPAQLESLLNDFAAARLLFGLDLDAGDERGRYQVKLVNSNALLPVNWRTLALRFVLTGDLCDPTEADNLTPLYWIVRGRAAVPHELEGVVAFYLTPEEVRLAADDLAHFDNTASNPRLTCKSLNQHLGTATATGEAWTDGGVAEIALSLLDIRSFYEIAAKTGSAIVFVDVAVDQEAPPN